MNATTRALRLVPALAILILAGGCGGDSENPAQTGGDVGEPVSGGSAVITEGADMVTPHAILAQSAFDGNLGGDVMFMGLLKGDWVDGALVFQTAEESDERPSESDLEGLKRAGGEEPLGAGSASPAS